MVWRFLSREQQLCSAMPSVGLSVVMGSEPSDFLGVWFYVALSPILISGVQIKSLNVKMRKPYLPIFMQYIGR